MPKSCRHRPLARILSLSSLMAVGLVTTPGLTQTETDDVRQGRGRIVEAPKNIYDFAPSEEFEAVDASRVEIRQVLRDLGTMATTWYGHVTTLADPFFEGRVAATRGMVLAGEYVAFHYQRYGLTPAFPEGDDDDWTSYFQPFIIEARDGPVLAVVKSASLNIDGHQATFEEDFVILGNSGNGRAAAPVTFVGYGIVGGEDDYTSFEEDTDLTGRIAMVLRYEPLDEEGKSRWSEEAFSAHSSLRRKLRRLMTYGAEAILVVNPPGAADGQTGLEAIERSSLLGRGLGIPIAQITPELANDLLIQTDPQSRDLDTLRRLADRGEIRTVDLDDDTQVELTSSVERVAPTKPYPGRNCGGVLPGRGALADEWLVIGGHYDHVGIGQLAGARAGNRGQVHPGADDNASGTAGVLALAEQFSQMYADAPEDADLRSVLFLAFDAEEQGLLGSAHYTDNLTLDPHQITLMLNLDMIGRLRNDNLLVLGSGTAEGLEDLLVPLIEDSGLLVSMGADSSGRSDEAHFIRVGVPGLHFFTGITAEYHTPQDEFHTIDPRGAATILNLALKLATELATRDEKLEFTTPVETRTTNRAGAPICLGIRTSMSADLDGGILVAGVLPNSIADDADIKKGDILLRWDDKPLETTQDLSAFLQEHKPGDVVKIQLKRGERTITLDVKLKASE